MLATQAPTEEQKENLADYDSFSREPLAATVVGFVLLAVLTTMLFRGAGALPPPHRQPEGTLLAQLPGKLQRSLDAARNRVVIAADGDKPEQVRWESVLRTGEMVGRIDPKARTVEVAVAGGAPRTIPWPADFTLDNVEGVGFNLLNDHPGSIEIAGVILLMAMLGAVVLARKKVQADEEDKSHQARTLMGGGGGS